MRPPTLRLRPLAALALLLFAAVSAFAWTQSRHSQGANPLLFVSGGSLTFRYEMNLSPSAGKAASDTALDAARATINNVTTSDANAGRGTDFNLTEPIDDDVAGGVANDMENRIFFFTTDNDNMTPDGVLAFAAAFANTTTGQIVECDIAFNEDNFVWNTANPDLQGVATHEETHCYGISHSAVAGFFNSGGHEIDGFLGGNFTHHATMYPFASGTTNDRTFNPDDEAALSDLYSNAMTTANLGTISGEVRDGANNPVVGAHVVAVSTADTSIPVVGFFSDTDNATATNGAYRLLVPPGNYFVRIEPLTGFLNGFTPPGFAGANMFHTVAFNNTFPPQFFNVVENATDVMPGSSDAAMVTVTAGMTTSNVDFVTNTVNAMTNDNFANRLALTNTFSQAFNVAAATTEGTDPLVPGACGTLQGGTRTVWFTFTAPEAGTVTFSTNGSSYDTIAHAISGNAPGASVACDDDIVNFGSTTFNPGSEISFAVANGDVRHFIVYDIFGNAPFATLVVNFSFVGTNATPVAVNDSYTTGPNQQLVIDDGCPGASTFNDLLCNDTDADGNPLMVDVPSLTQPANGAVVVMADGSFTYTPDLGFSGMDTFTYRATDGTALSNIATVTVTVNQCTRVFDNDSADNQFETTNNWAPDGVPGSGVNEDLCIGASFAGSGNFPVTHSVGGETIFSLRHTSTMPFTMSGGTLSMDGNSEIGSGGLVLTGGTLDMGAATTLTINGLVDFQAGTMAGSGGSFLLSGGATFSTGADKALDTSTVTIPVGQNGNWTDGSFQVIGTGVFQNDGILNINGGQDFGGGGTVNNTGTVNKMDAGATRMFSFFSNSGTVNVDAGTFNIVEDGDNTGSISVDMGAILGFQLGNFSTTTFNHGTGGSVSGMGLMDVGDQATVNFDSGSSLSAPTQVRLGTLNLNDSSAANVPNLIFADAGDVNVNTPLSIGATGLIWPCGTFGGTSSISLNGPSTLNDTACGDKVLAFVGSLDNNVGQTMTWTGGNIQFNANNQISNRDTFLIQTDADITQGPSFVGGGIVNQANATITKSVTAGTTDVGVVLLNNGNLQLDSGTLNFMGGFTQQSTGLTTLNGGTLASTGLLTFDGGILRGNGTITGNVDINTATLAPGINAPGVLNQTGTLNINSTGAFTVDLGGTTPGTGAGFHDQHNVTGTANLAAGSTLNVGLTSFTPMIGDTFLILTATTRIGQFTTLNLPDVSPNSFQVNYLATGVELEVVPNAAPNAVDDNVVTLEDTTLSQITPLDNDSDTDGPNPLSISAVSDPPNGTAVIDMGNLTVSYTPDPDFNGMDSFTYDVTDGVNTVQATIFVTVTPVNDAPVFNLVVVGAGGPEDGFSSVNGVTSGMAPGPMTATDEAGQNLTFIVMNDNPALFTTPPAIDTTTGDMTFTLAPDQNGSAFLTVTLMDDGGTANGGVDSTTAGIIFQLDVFPVNDPPVANDDMFTVGENSMNNILPVEANDTPGPPTATDEVSQTLTITMVGVPDMGGTAMTDGTTITYSPAMNFTGVETFTYTTDDGNGGTDTALVTVNVIANFPPVAGDDMAATNEDTPVIINVLANDNDGGDGGALSVTMVTAPANGMAVINMDNTITYTPNPDFNGMDSFDYTVSDTFTTDTATVNVTVTAVNDQPSFADAGDVTVDEDMGPYTIAGWATNILPGPMTATDEAGQGLTFIVTGNTNPALFSAGPAVNAMSGDLTFSTPLNAFGSADITIVLMDDGGTANGGVDTSASSTFTITVNNINDPPVITAGPTSNPASPIPGNNAMGASVMFSITVSDPDNDPLTFAWSGGCGASAVEDPTLTCPFGMGLSVDVTVSDPSMATDMGNIVVDVTDYSIAAACQGGMPPCNSATMATIAAGQAVNFNLTATGINGTYAANITYSCMNLPAQTSCVFTPSASVANAPPGGVVTMLQIRTTAPGFAQLQGPASPQRSQPPFLALFMTVPGLALFGLVLAGGRGKRRSLGSLCLLAIVLLMAGVLVGCGSGGDFFTGLGNPGTPTGSHAITINAQGTGTLSRSVNLTVVVQ